jgi:predicted transcriptional regulator YheO
MKRQSSMNQGISNSELVRSYIPMVDFISDIMGNNCEVVLHDLTDPEKSIVAIRNGHLSGRKLGGPLTDLVLKVIKNRSYEEQPYVANYKAMGSKRKFRSSSYFIKNLEEQIIGVLCVNIDIEPYICVKAIMDSLTAIKPLGVPAPEPEEGQQSFGGSNGGADEKFFSSIDDMLDSMIQEEISIANFVPARMTVGEKVEIVYRLNEKGTFQLKGAVAKVAKAFGVSEPTVYRYLNMGKID